MIELIDLHKAYGASPALDGVTLQLPAGQISALIGPSGSGKSTLLRCINRLVEPDRGQVRWQGRDVRALPVEALRRRMGYVIQSMGLFPHWTVARNIGCVPTLLGWPQPQIDARTDELLTLLGLPPGEFRQRRPHQLSGGQQQRVGVARALAARPELLLMDEPFGALDPLSRGALQQALIDLHRASGQSIVIVTHDIDEALRLAQHIVLLSRGRVLQAGTPAELLGRPASAEVADFLGRAELGLRLLGLLTVADRMRPLGPPDTAGSVAPGAAATGAPVSASLSLREALSIALARQVDRLPVVGADGQPRGTLHLADLLRQTSPAGGDGAAP